MGEDFLKLISKICYLLTDIISTLNHPASSVYSTSRTNIPDARKLSWLDYNYHLQGECLLEFSSFFLTRMPFTFYEQETQIPQLAL